MKKHILTAAVSVLLLCMLLACTALADDGTIINVAPAGGNDTLYVQLNQTANLAVEVETSGDAVVSYQWYEGERTYYNYTRSYSTNYSEIEGAVSSSLVTNPVTTAEYYMCSIADSSGSSWNVYFNVCVDNQLSATHVGEYRTYVTPGESASLEVYASCSSGSLSYQWFQCADDPDEDDVAIVGAVSSSYETEACTSFTQYLCIVKDEYDNTEYLFFEVRMDNQLSADRVGDSDRFVGLQETTLLEVNASCLNGDLSYQWYRGVENYFGEEGSYSTDYTIIEGATGSSVETQPVSTLTNYYCYIEDMYGNYTYIYFYIHVNNELQADPVGDNDKYVALGASETLEISASCASGDLTCQWYSRDENNNYHAIEGATNTTYETDAITHYTEYFCHVGDMYQNFRDVYFAIYIDNQLQAEPVGDDNRYVAPGESETLEISASCASGELIYQWYYYDENDYSHTIEGATSASYETDAITHYTEYFCRVGDMYQNFRDVYFEIHIDNQLQAEPVEDDDRYVVPGESETLEISASCASGELTYQWYIDDDEIAGADSASYETGPVNDPGTYECRVRDQYGNMVAVRFFIEIGAEITAQAAGGEHSIKAGPGQSAQLAVEASVSSGELHYQWYESYWDSEEDEEISVLQEGATDAIFTISSVTGPLTYFCTVSNDWGQSTNVWFYVSVDNGLTVAAEQGPKITAEADSSVTLKVNASCDVGTLSYRWIKWTAMNPKNETVEGETPDTVVIPAVTEHYYYKCIVSDEYGNSRFILFEISVENGFQAERVGGYEKVAVIGDPVTMQVEASANDNSVCYAWYYYDDEGNETVIEGAEESTYSFILAADSPLVYKCSVTASHGEKVDINFYIKLVDGIIPLAPDQTVTVSITNAGSKVMCTFRPEADGIYKFTSLSDSDTYVELYNEDMNYILDDDDGGTGDNFLINAYLKGGQTYYYMVRYYEDDETGSFDVSLTGREITVSDSSMILPAELTAIEAEAFEGSAITEVFVPDGCRTIGSKAFANCPNVVLIHMPNSVTSIAADAFANTDVVFLCSSWNYAAEYAQDKNFAFTTR